MATRNAIGGIHDALRRRARRTIEATSATIHTMEGPNAAVDIPTTAASLQG